MRHLEKISRQKCIAVPALAGDDQVCGLYPLTGTLKCVDRSSPKADKLESVAVP